MGQTIMHAFEFVSTAYSVCVCANVDANIIHAFYSYNSRAGTMRFGFDVDSFDFPQMWLDGCKNVGGLINWDLVMCGWCFFMNLKGWCA